MSDKKIIVFSPHPDDEVCGCGGTIAKRTKDGYQVIVVIMTDGSKAYHMTPGISESFTVKEYVKMRKEEAANALRILGLEEEQLIFLNYKDGFLRPDSKEIERRIIEELARYSPTEVYCPYEKDAHPDHRATSHLVRNAIKKTSFITPKYYEYSISNEYDFLGRKIDIFLKKLQHKIYEEDISNFLILKEKAINQYASQVSIITEKQKKPILRNVSRFLKNKEKFFI